MPSAMTHAYFADDVYRKLPARVKNKIEKDTLRVFSQGPDVFYFDWCHPDVVKFGHTMHQKKAKLFFQTYIEYMKKYRLEKKNETISAFYGFLLHYILDMMTHPLIFYKTGTYRKGDKAFLKYRSLHREMELLIDLFYMEKKEKKSPKKIKHYQYLFPTTAFTPSFENLLNDTMKRTYQKKEMGKHYMHAVKKMKRGYRIYRYDRFGVKLKLYRFLDCFMKKTNVKFCYQSYAIDLRKKADYFNHKHETWCYPLDHRIQKNDSFFELYKQSILVAVAWVTEFHDVFMGKKDVKDVMENFPSNSYITGLSDERKGRMKYFEF